MKKRVDFVADVQQVDGDSRLYKVQQDNEYLGLRDETSSETDWYWIPQTASGLAFLEAVVEAMKTLLKEGGR
jgi:hypothetical protein